MFLNVKINLKCGIIKKSNHKNLFQYIELIF